MKTIRYNTFETNSSSMHAIVVNCARVDNSEYIRTNLEKFKQDDGSYKIDVILDEDNLEEGDFTCRSYIPHYSINDKLMYAYAAIKQHFENRYILDRTNGSKPTGFMLDFNKNVYKDFSSKLKDLEDDLSYAIRKSLFGCAPNSEEDTRPKVTVTFVQKPSYESLIENKEEDDDYFSTGCYGNEEFYYAVCECGYWLKEWVLNPYCAILAGGDEMDDDLYYAQRKEAKRLMDESWLEYIMKYTSEYGNDDLDYHLALNPAKVIWPIGG